MVKKQTINVFNSTYYLLGKDKQGKKYYLETPTWDCGWYWGFGYIVSFSNNRSPQKSNDVDTLNHYDSMILSGSSPFLKFSTLFEETPLTKDEIWELSDLMKTCYVLKEAAEIFKKGYSNYTEKAKTPEIISKDIEDNINKNILPVLFDKIINIVKE